MVSQSLTNKVLYLWMPHDGLHELLYKYFLNYLLLKYEKIFIFIWRLQYKSDWFFRPLFLLYVSTHYGACRAYRYWRCKGYVIQLWLRYHWHVSEFKCMCKFVYLCLISRSILGCLRVDLQHCDCMVWLTRMQLQIHACEHWCNLKHNLT